MEYDKILQYFTDQAKTGTWDTLYDPSNPLSHSFIHRYRKSINLINSNNNNNIIDLGCGTGILISYAIEKKLKYFGMDNSQEMLDIINKNYPDEIKNNSVNLILADFQNYKHLNNFDIFFGIGFIEYFDSPFEEITKIIDLLDKEKQLILSFPNKFSLDSFMLKVLFFPKKIISLIFNKNTKQPPRRMFTVNEVKKYMNNQKGYKFKIVNYNTNIFTYPFTKFFPRFSNYMGNIFEDSFLNKFSFFSSGFIVKFEKKS